MKEEIRFINLCDYPLVLKKHGGDDYTILPARPGHLSPVGIEEKCIATKNLGGIELNKTRYILKNVPPGEPGVIYLIDHPGLNTTRPDERNDVVNIMGTFSDEGPWIKDGVKRVFVVTGFKVRSEKLFDNEKRLFVTAAAGDVGGLVALLRQGVNINIRKKGEATPLHVACTNLQHNIIKALVENGADVNVRNGVNRTPLHELCCKPGASQDTIKMLLDRGADAGVRDDEGFTALHYSASWKGGEKLAAVILDCGIPPDILSDNGNNGNLTPLHIAACYGRTDTVCLLLEKGAEVSMRNSHGETPLHLACWNGHAETVKALSYVGASWAAVDRRGQTPFDCIMLYRTGNVPCGSCIAIHPYTGSTHEALTEDQDNRRKETDEMISIFREANPSASRAIYTAMDMDDDKNTLKPRGL